MLALANLNGARDFLSSSVMRGERSPIAEVSWSISVLSFVLEAESSPISSGFSIK